MSHVPYHNTTPIHGDELLQAVMAAQKQDDMVMAFFDRGGAWTPSEVHGYLTRAGRKTLLTSVRRAISNLAKAKLLVVTGMTKMGPHGRPENIWSKS